MFKRLTWKEYNDHTHESRGLCGRDFHRAYFETIEYSWYALEAAYAEIDRLSHFEKQAGYLARGIVKHLCIPVEEKSHDKT